MKKILSMLLLMSTSILTSVSAVTEINQKQIESEIKEHKIESKNDFIEFNVIYKNKKENKSKNYSMQLLRDNGKKLSYYLKSFEFEEHITKIHTELINGTVVMDTEKQSFKTGLSINLVVSENFINYDLESIIKIGIKNFEIYTINDEKINIEIPDISYSNYKNTLKIKDSKVVLIDDENQNLTVTIKI